MRRPRGGQRLPSLGRALAGRLLLIFLGLFFLLDLLGTLLATLTAQRVILAERRSVLASEVRSRAVIVARDLFRARGVLKLVLGLRDPAGLLREKPSPFPFTALTERIGPRRLRSGRPGIGNVAVSVGSPGERLTGYVDPAALLLPAPVGHAFLLLGPPPEYRILGATVYLPTGLGRPPLPPFLRALRRARSGTLTFRSRLGRVLLAYAPVPGEPYTLALAEELGEELGPVHLVAWDLALVGLFGLLLLSLLVLLLARRLVRPWEHLLTALATFEGPTAPALPEEGFWPERLLSRAVNRSLADLREAQEMTQALKEAYAALSADRPTPEILAIIARQAAEITGASHSFILMRSRGGDLAPGGHYGATREAERDFRRLDPALLAAPGSPPREAFLRGKTLVYPERAPLGEAWEGFWARLGMAHGISCPLRPDPASPGVITLWTPGREFSDRDIRLVEEFARTAAVVLERTEAYTEIRQQREELELLYSFSQRLGEAGSEEAVLDLVLEIATDSLGLTDTALGLIREGDLTAARRSGRLARLLTPGRLTRLWNEASFREAVRGPKPLVLGVREIPSVLGSWPALERLLRRSPESRVGIFPLMAFRESLGALLVFSPGPLGEATARLAANLAREAALDLANLRQRRRLEDWAIRDPLTGLYNRRFLEEAFERELSRAERTGSPFTLALLDLDNFKTLNDTRGHQEGDRALVLTGRALLRTVRAADVVARLGGDEFALLFPATDRRTALEVLPRLIASLPLAEFSLGVSAGLAVHPEDGDSYQKLYRAADLALYRSKEAGKGRIS